MKLKIKIIKEFIGIKFYKNIIITFEQAKMIDVIKFLDNTKKNEFDLWLWILNFVKEHWKVKKNDEWSIYLHWWPIFEQIKNIYFKWLFKDTKWKSDNSPIISLITFIAKESWISTLDILYKMTYEELELVTEWVIWNLNEQSDKGKKKNRMANLYKKSERTEEEKQEIKNKLEKLKSIKL